MTIEWFPDDEEISRDFLRSPEWSTARDAGRWRKKHGLTNAIRDYLIATYPWMKEPSEELDRAKLTVRVEALIRSRWAKKAARTKKRNKRLRKLKKLRLAESAHEKWRKARAPELWSDLPVLLKPKRSRG